MKQDDFLCEYFKPHDTVTVNANDLQELIKAKKEAERLLRISEDNCLKVTNLLVIEKSKNLYEVDLKC